HAITLSCTVFRMLRVHFLPVENQMMFVQQKMKNIHVAASACISLQLYIPARLQRFRSDPGTDLHLRWLEQQCKD
ncbi:hypothetical protein LI129_22290, partial [Erysipelatoclostridium ramosum]|uniref:hypothetical protein n=1 Tax=Thomasclavelia ramosa TaxID=1547 RepID=UPI001D0629B2